MITVTCQLSGGLGNQLSQVANALIYAESLGINAVFDNSNYTRLTQGNFEYWYKKSIFRKLKWQKIGDNVEFIPSNLSTELFDSSRDRLVKTFKPPIKTVAELTTKYSAILSKPNCAIHVRRGDLARFPGLYKILSPDYYQDAINNFDRDTKFLVFSDDLKYCKRIFIGENFYFSDEAQDDRDLYLMSLCQHQIVANSTFSWWGAFLNTNPGKIVLHPQI